ncbi:Protein CBG00619 [Caenorhabditis briggsae]|uniref:Protein CBG00619 n=1 Tax=Caenorhabditis briggsae TaxID=6238 RepID=A8WNF9_CAEBR|nr:Protein CBG00619 [Caenorhabditis briggsae]CAP22013.2 Protein CBG00619 [Caenorhabditis briggsae]
MNTLFQQRSKITALCHMAIRRYSIENVLPKDLKVVKNPSDSQIEQFQKLVVRDGGNEIPMLKETMKERYHLYLLCQKDSTVVSGTQSIIYKSLNPSTPDFQVFGLFYQHENTFNFLPHLMSEMAADLNSVSMNSGGCVGRIFEDSKNAAIWRKVLHTKVRGSTYYVSDYTSDEVFNPELEFDDVAVKKFQDIPADDIVKYDNTIFPYQRQELLLAKFKGGIGRVAYDKSGKVIGIGLVSFDKSSGNCEIGPIYSDTKNAAQAMFHSILGEMNGGFKEIRVRCSDKFEGSATWVRPFLRRRHEMTPFAYVKFNRVIPDGLNMSKVFVSSSPSSAPC